MTPESRPFRARRALLVFAAYFGAQFAGGVFTGIAVAIWYAVAVGLRTPGATAQAMRPATMLGAIVGMIVGGIVAYLVVRRMVGGRRDGGHALEPFGWQRSTWRSVLAALSIGFAIGVLYLFAAAAFPTPKGANPGLMARSIAGGGWTLYAWAFLAVVVAPPVEEFVFRGVVWTGLERSWGPWAAGIAATALFVAMHVAEAWSSVPALVAIGAMGVAALAMRIASKSLVPAIALHTAYNVVVAGAVLGSGR